MSVYYIAVIDLLATYSCKWAVQRVALGCVTCKETREVSAVPPGQYKDRLLSFIEETLLAPLPPDLTKED
jgi:hypothetical protein